MNEPQGQSPKEGRAKQAPEATPDPPDSLVQRVKNDPQVARALELLKGWEMFRGLAGSGKAT